MESGTRTTKLSKNPNAAFLKRVKDRARDGIRWINGPKNRDGWIPEPS